MHFTEHGRPENDRGDICKVAMQTKTSRKGEMGWNIDNSVAPLATVKPEKGMQLEESRESLQR